MAKFAVILPAAGRSSRFHDKHYKKPFAPLDGRAVWMHSAERFINRSDVIQTILVIAKDDREYFQFKFASNAALLGIEVVDGGAQRHDSVAKPPWPGSSPRPISSAYTTPPGPASPTSGSTRSSRPREKTGAAIFAIPVAGTLKRVGPDHRIQETVSRTGLWEAQTPQVFRRELLLEAYAKRGSLAATDDAQLGRAARPCGNRGPRARRSI